MVFPVTVAGQTQVDLGTQSKNIDFSSAEATIPTKTGAVLPGACETGELFFLITAPAGQNLYACTSADTWTAASSPSGSGTVTVQAEGVTVGARATQNFIPGVGIVNTVVDTGTKINLSHAANTAVVETKASAQTGAALRCASASASGSAYTCSLNPALGSYVEGMVLTFEPDVDGTGGATTLNIDALGAVPLKKADGATDPISTDIVGGQLYHIWYDGALLRLMYVP